MSKDIKEAFKSCEECQTNAISKMNTDVETVLEDLQLLAPNEVIHLDFCTIVNTNILVLKDKATGWLCEGITKNQTNSSVEKVFLYHFHMSGRVQKVFSNEDPHSETPSPSFCVVMTSPTD